MTRDPRVDAYIARAAPFAQPILAHLRAAVHGRCPEAAEAIKWGMPAFMLRGRILANMAAFKQHATFGFWRGEEVTGESNREAMGSFGRITRVEDLPPPATLAELIGAAAALIEAGPAPRVRKHPPKPAPDMPADFAAAIAASPAAAAAFDSFPPGAQREYVEWIVEAKREETRRKRIAQAVEWIGEGKRRNWKYENC